MVRTVKEVQEAAEVLLTWDITREITLAPSHFGEKKIKFIVSATEDDLSDDGWRSLFQACEGKTDEEIVRIAYNMTNTDDIRSSEDMAE